MINLLICMVLYTTYIYMYDCKSLLHWKTFTFSTHFITQTVQYSAKLNRIITKHIIVLELFSLYMYCKLNVLYRSRSILSSIICIAWNWKQKNIWGECVVVSLINEVFFYSANILFYTINESDVLIIYLSLFL